MMTTTTHSAITPEKIQPLDFEKPLIALEKQIETLLKTQNNPQEVADQLNTLQQQAEALRQQVYGNLLPAQRLQIARHPQRPNRIRWAAYGGSWYAKRAWDEGKLGS
jgi:acetyl-CoA carboxylase carboxyl transferase subunit alpha